MVFELINTLIDLHEIEHVTCMGLLMNSCDASIFPVIGAENVKIERIRTE